ncbi:hypothetical protein ACLSZW_02290 [Avibacterium avium]|uniref:hypothetical protein n=1 Tax=Avibacterium avium TaxID=751 RepID=UPI003BF82381
MSRFIKKPVEIEARQINFNDDKNLIEITEWKDDVDLSSIYYSALAKIRSDIKSHDGYPIRTLEGIMIASDGDWIIKGIRGEFYPCKPDIFEQTYEKVGD